MTCERAVPELVALAVAVREDWDATDLHRAIGTATQTGMPWPRLLWETVRLLLCGGSPRDLSAQAADPTKRQLPPEGTYERGLAAARAAIRVQP